MPRTAQITFLFVFWDLSVLSVINGYTNNIYVNNNMSVSL